jgi:hypothetical protein
MKPGRDRRVLGFATLGVNLRTTQALVLTRQHAGWTGIRHPTPVRRAWMGFSALGVNLQAGTGARHEDSYFSCGFLTAGLDGVMSTGMPVFNIRFSIRCWRLTWK